MSVKEFGPREYDNLFVQGIQPIVPGKEIITGGAYARGTVLGYITATNKCTIVNSAVDPANGSETVYAVLADDVDATEGDVEAVVYYTGEFNSNKLLFGGTDTAATHKVAARKIGLFFKEAVPA